AVTARLVDKALGPIETAWADTIEQFALVMVKLRSPYAVIASRQIVSRLWATLGQADSSFIVALDDPRLALENLVVRHGMEFVEATRVVARSCASSLSCAPLSRALVLRAEQSEMNPVTAATLIARHFGLEISLTEVTNIVNNIKVWPAAIQNT